MPIQNKYARANDNRTTLILADNQIRLPQFRTKTTVEENNEGRFVYKQALTKEAVDFLGIVTQREIANSDYLRGKFNVLCGTLKGERLEYQYLPYRSITDIVGEHLKDKNWSAASDILKKYVLRLESLPTEKAIPEKFLQTIAGDTSDHTVTMNCLCRGLLDIMPRNILVNGNHWIVVDNEWSFDFPVPLDFILFRAILEVSIDLQNEVCKAADKSFPLNDLLIFGINKKFFVPLSWIKYIGHDNITLDTMMGWEAGFQRYVRGSSYVSFWRINKHPRIVSSCPKAKTKILNGFKMVVKNIPGSQKAINFLRKIILKINKRNNN